MPVLTLTEIKTRTMRGETVESAVHVQVENLLSKSTKEGKPYYEAHFLDACERLTLRVWSDAPAYGQFTTLANGHCVEISGEFQHHAQFGLEAKRYALRTLTLTEQQTLLAGPPEVRARQDAGYRYIVETLETLRDPRLRYVWELFLSEYGERFRRSAAARYNHHARRGGLVEHVAGMMRAASALADAYPRLHRDLLLSGVLFHDCGKLWENHVPTVGFGIEQHEIGELLGHINVGIELVNSLWRQMRTSPDFAEWKHYDPPSESVRIHLLHLVASHHGTHEFGAPVLPKTPEALALHHVDNLDAKLEMIFQGYDTLPQVTTNVYEKVRPLSVYPVTPLGPFALPRAEGVLQ